MSYLRFCVCAATLCALTVGHPQHQRRTLLGPPPALPLSKNGWRPVVGAGPPSYSAYGAAPLHAAYKIPIPVIDYSSSRPIVTRDAAKLTSITQSYRPTTIRTVQVAPNQPINSYFNPFALPYTGISHYKIVQNFPKENLVIRNPHGPFARPHSKQKPKNVFDSIIQQQQLPFDYKPHEVFLKFAKPVDSYARPGNTKKPMAYKDPNAPEVFKPEVFELTDNTAAPQSVQQVKTQQQQLGATKTKGSTSFQHYPLSDEKFASIPASLLGTFTSFGVQSMKNRDPVFQSTKTTYLPPAPTKQTVFNSFSFTPTFKTTTNQFTATTPKLPQITSVFDTDLKVPIQQTKQNFKIDYSKDSFKPSPQDLFHKTPQHQISNTYTNDITKLSQTYTTTLPTTTVLNSYYNDFTAARLPSQLHSPLNSFYQPNLSFENRIPTTQNALTNKEINNVYSTAPNKVELEVTPNSIPFRATYEVTENSENGDIITHSSPNSWSGFEHNVEIPLTQLQSENNIYNKPITTTHPEEIPETYSITETTDDYKSPYNYDKNIESQNAQFTVTNEPVIKNKLKDHYYKVSTPTYEEENHKNKFETTTKYTDSNWDHTNHFSASKDKENGNELNVEALPTLPPNKHFRRPSAQEPIDRNRIRKRVKTRRRRPQHGNSQRDTEESNPNISSTTEVPTIIDDEIYTVRPRNKPSSPSQPKQTTPTVTTDLSTSALPTTSSTNPTIVKKKIGHRRVTTTTEKLETTTFSYRAIDDTPIMKIVNKPQQTRATSSYEYGNETPDYTHKQDEKDTPTSDIAISTSENNYRNKYEPQKNFSFHKDKKPIEAITERLSSKNEHVTEKEKNEQKQGTESSKEDTDVTTFASRTENYSQLPGKIQRPKLKGKYDGNRPRFSVKDYRNRLSSTTTTTEKPSELQTSKLRFPQRRPLLNENNENATEPRRKFTPKDPRRNKSTQSEEKNYQTDKEQSTRLPQRQRATALPTEVTSEAITQKISSRIRKKPKPVEEQVEETSQIPTHVRRIVRKKSKDSDTGQSFDDITVTETTVNYEKENSSERNWSESAIMKIAKDDKKYHVDHFDNLFEHSKRVSDLTLAASKDYNTPGMFKTVSPTSRRIPSYFTIATDDPILPIEAFFPQLNQKKES